MKTLRTLSWVLAVLALGFLAFLSYLWTLPSSSPQDFLPSSAAHTARPAPWDKVTTPVDLGTSLTSSNTDDHLIRDAFNSYRETALNDAGLDLTEYAAPFTGSPIFWSSGYITWSTGDGFTVILDNDLKLVGVVYPDWATLDDRSVEESDLSRVWTQIPQVFDGRPAKTYVQLEDHSRD